MRCFLDNRSNSTFLAGRRKATWTALLVTAAALLLLACGQATEEGAEPPGEPVAQQSPVRPFAAAIGRAHGIEDWRAKDALEAGITVNFGGNTILDGKMLVEVGEGRSRLELQDSVTLVFDGEQAWVSPADAEFPRARFHVRTWPYFLAAPMKLQDEGANLETTGTREIEGQTHETAKLTFDPGVGDTPDDWYVLYKDPDSHRLRAMAYIVTYGKSVDEASEEPHAITYDEYVEVDGVLLSNKWTFRHWSEEKGVHGDPIGEATLESFRFVTPAPDAFQKPADAKANTLPEQSG